MPPNGKRAAPGTRAARRDQHHDESADPLTPSNVALDVAHRREAASRLAPLEDGARDPLDALADVPVRVVERARPYDVTDLGLSCAHGDSCPARRQAS